MMYCSWIRMKVRHEGVDDDNEKHLRKLMEAELNTAKRFEAYMAK